MGKNHIYIHTSIYTHAIYRESIYIRYTYSTYIVRIYILIKTGCAKCGLFCKLHV